MLVSLALAGFFTLTPLDTEARSRAWRVVDTDLSANNIDCSQACSETPDANRDTSCIQEAIYIGTDRWADGNSSTEPYSGVELPQGWCRIYRKLEILNRSGIEFYGAGRGPTSENRTMLLWVGPPMGSLLYLGDVSYSYFHDFEIQPDVQHLLGAGIQIDNCSGCAFGSDPILLPGGSTHNVFERITMNTPATTQLMIDGFVVSPLNGDGNDFHVFRNTLVSGHIQHAYRLESPQNKSIGFDHSTCLSTSAYQNDDYFLDLRESSFDPEDESEGVIYDLLHDFGNYRSSCVASRGCFSFLGGGGGSHSGYDFLLEATGCPSTIIDANFEGSYGFLFMGPQDAAGPPSPDLTADYFGITVTGLRWAQNGVPEDVVRPVIVNRTPGGLMMTSSQLGDRVSSGSLKRLVIELRGGNVAQPNTFIGNLIVSSERGADLWNPPPGDGYFFPEIAEANYQIWCTNSDPGCNSVNEMEPLDLPIGTLGDSSPAMSVSPGLVGPTGTMAFVGTNTLSDLIDRVGVTDPVHEGHRVRLWCDDCLRRVANNSNFHLAGNRSFTMQPDDTLDLMYLDGAWREIGRTRRAQLWYDTQSAPSRNGGTSATTAVAFSVSHVVQSDTLLDHDRVEIRAYVDVASLGGAASYSPTIRWGGVDLQTVSIPMASGNAVMLEAWLNIDNADATPDWGYYSKSQVLSGTSVASASAWGLTAPSTASNITVDVTTKFVGGTPNSSDVLRLRDFTVRIHRE